jgi:hypothetical protein
MGPPIGSLMGPGEQDAILLLPLGGQTSLHGHLTGLSDLSDVSDLSDKGERIAT